MSRRVSQSVLDPWISPPLKALYRRVPIPAAVPPECVVLAGHLCAAAAGVGFAFSTSTWWGGLLAAAGVAGNHTADVLDGTHARATGQCRNGGELLDHFTDPLSFCYYLIGIAVSCGRLDLGLAAVIILYATAVLTNIKAKLVGEFTLHSFGPTEFKMLLVLYGLTLSGLGLSAVAPAVPARVALWSFAALIGVGAVQLLVGLVRAVCEVNAHGTAPDQTEWIIRSTQPSGSAPAAKRDGHTPSITVAAKDQAGRVEASAR